MKVLHFLTFSILLALVQAEIDLSGGSMDGYYGYDEINGLLGSITIGNLTIAPGDMSPSTHDGHEIHYYKVSSPEGIPESDRPNVVVSASLYSGFPMSTSAVLHAINLLMTNDFYSKRLNAYFIPVMNPDAYIEMETEYANASDGFHVSFKNKRAGICTTDESSSGVNLNRNFDAYYDQNLDGSTNNPCSDYYRGQHALSEPETQAITEFAHSMNIAAWLHFEYDSDRVILPLTSISESFETFEPLLTEVTAFFYDNLQDVTPYDTDTAFTFYGHEEDGTLLDFAYLEHYLTAQVEIEAATEASSIPHKLAEVTELIEFFYDSVALDMAEPTWGVSEFVCGEGYTCKSTASTRYLIFDYIVWSEVRAVDTSELVVQFTVQFTEDTLNEITPTAVYRSHMSLDSAFEAGLTEDAIELDLDLGVVNSTYGQVSTTSTAEGVYKTVFSFVVERNTANATGDVQTSFSFTSYPSSLTADNAEFVTGTDGSVTVGEELLESVTNDKAVDGGDNDDGSDGSDGLSSGAIAGIVIGVVLGCALIIGVIIWCLCRKKPRRPNFAQNNA